ncbi:pyridoxal phosphate-dependent aminotransferase [Chloroflexota bacterium]
MKLSGKLSRLGTESAFIVLAKAQSLESKGVDVIHLEIGEPDFSTPSHICEAATRALNNGQTHYCNSQGLLPLRAEITKKLKESHGIVVDPARIVVSPGAKPIMFYSILALLGEGDEAIYPDPSFPIYASMINFTGAKAVPIELHEKQEFRFDVTELRAKVTPRTRLIILNSPHNPTGSILEKDDILAIADIANTYDITVLSDEVYEHFIYEGQHNSIVTLPGMLDKTILLSGFSKSYAMTGWRLGYAVMPPDLVDPIVRLIVNSVSCTAPFTQYAGIEALSGSQDSVNQMVAEFKKRRDLFVDGLNKIPGMSCLCPKGAFYLFPNIKKLGMSSKQLADYLLNNAGVATLAGSDFGNSGEGYLRLSYANSLEKIKEALERIRTAVSKIPV